tara:strand:+ start:457 stop:666 length:210 start_codon:yes stop_codon:yes gene_type:complete
MEALVAKRKELLEEKKESDLELVKKLCKQHGFMATQLRGVLKVKGKNTKTTESKPAIKKTAAKKATKTK